jgi:LPXTG-motif cell wall-anchored protein
VTFTPTDLALPPYTAGSGYATTAADIGITVVQATPTFEASLSSASQIKNGEALSASTITGVVTGAFGEQITGTFAWVNPGVIPSDTLGASGGIGTYNAQATFTPSGDQAYAGLGTFADYYEPLTGPLEVTIPVEVLVDKTALIALEDLIENTLGVLGANIHEQNYIAADVQTLKDAIAAANIVLGDPLATQVDVDGALGVLQIAYNALQHDHPVLSHTHPNGVTTRGQTVSIEIKGHVEDVTSLSLGSTVYNLGPAGPAGERAILQGGTQVGQLTKGSAIVTFNATTINALANGKYPLIVTFVDNKGTGYSTNSVVANSEVVVNRSAGGSGDPRTGDDSNLALWLALALAAMAGFIVLFAIRRRTRKHEKA